MIEEPKEPRIKGDELIIETQSSTEVYDAKYLVAALLVFVAKGDGNISGEETEQMIELINEHFGVPSSTSLELLTNAMEDIADNPDFENLLKDLSKKVVASNGRKDAEEMDKLGRAADLIEIPPDTLHRAYDRYFEETQA